MSANDDEPYVHAEIDWLRVPLAEGVPYLGICLGAQMLAKHLGARVGFHPEGRIEAGYYPIRPTAAGRRLMSWPAYVYQWHREGFALPRGARLLAEGDACGSSFRARSRERRILPAGRFTRRGFGPGWRAFSTCGSRPTAAFSWMRPSSGSPQARTPVRSGLTPVETTSS